MPKVQPAPTVSIAGSRSENRAARARRGGRPSKEAAPQLEAKILEVATSLFLAEGYGATTIEAIATRAGVSKRTLYHRYADKSALFAAVVGRIIEQVRPPPDVPLLEGTTLEDVLRRLALLILKAALSPPALALHRLVIAEAARFPDLGRALSKVGGEQEGVALIGGLLQRELPPGSMSAADAAFAAGQFLQLVVTVPQRRAMGHGTPMSPAEHEAWADRVVRLFLRGCLGWPGSAAPQ